MTSQSLFPNLSRRAQIPELMDDPACSEERLLKTVRCFTLLNRLVSRYRPILRRWVLQDMLAQPDRSHRVADLGAGGCDIAVWLLRRAKKAGLDLSVLAVESNARIAEYARRMHGNTPGLTIVCQDATNLDALGDVDYIIGNHFLHHLADRDIAELLRRATVMRVRRFVFTDLHRNYRAYYLHSVLAALLFPRTLMGTDGRRSIRRGFRLRELRTLFDQAGILGRVEVHRMMPARVVIVGNGTAPASPA
jgi:hypothetical protein